MAVDLISVEVAYATAEEQFILQLKLPANCSAEAAIHASGLLQRCPEIDLGQQKIGIFNQVCSSQTILNDGDRVEIYRPLLLHPMEARRNRADKDKPL